MSHFFMVNDDARLRSMQVDDWLDVLAPFSADVVDAACKEWVGTKSRRPTPADIVKLCADSRMVGDRRRPSSPPPNWLEQHGLEPSPEAAQIFAAEHGFASWADVMSDGRPLAKIMEEKAKA